MDAAAEIFTTIKPICVKLAQLTLSNKNESGSIELLNALKELDDTLNKKVDSCVKKISDVQFFIPINLSDYIMVPLTNLFKNESITDSELEHVLSIMHILLKYSWCQSGSLSNELFIQYITLITFLIGGKPGHFSIKHHSDETFKNGIQCIYDLLNGCLNQNSDFIDNVLNDNKFVPTLGFLVTILLNIAVDSKIADIKIQSLKTLNVLFHLINNGEILSLFFPGSVSSIAKIINSKPHLNVISESFITLSTLVDKVFSDFDLDIITTNKINSLEALKEINNKETNDSNHHLSIESINIEIPENTSSKKQHRTSSWLKSTLPQFEKALKIILNVDITRYDKYAIRDSIFQFDVKMIRNCLLSCRPLIPLILKSLSTICVADPTFVTPTVDSLIYIANLEPLKHLLQEMLDYELRSMQYNFTSPDPSKAENTIQLVNLLIQILNGMESLDFLNFENIIRKLYENITILLELKNKSESKKKISKISDENETMEGKLLLVSNNYNPNTFNEIHNVSLFNGIFTKETENALYDLFLTLSLSKNNLEQFNASSILIDSRNILNLNTTQSSVLSWIVSCVIKNVQKKPEIMNDFLQFDDENGDNEENENTNESDVLNLKMNLSYSSLEISTSILKQLSNASFESFDIVSSSIMNLRVIDNAIKSLGQDFEDELIDVLYPVVECLASSNEQIRTEAQLVIINIAELLYSGSVENLLSENTDYLVDSLSSKLVGESLTPKIPVILSILVKIGSMDIVAELDDIIRTIFTLLDMYYEYSSLVEGFFLVFDEILSKVYKNLKNYSFEVLEKNCQEENVHTFGMWGLKSMDDVEEFITKKSVIYDDLYDSDDDETSDEQLRKSKILEVDSDDSDNENDTISIPSRISDKGDEDEDNDKWISPLNIKLYTTITNILSYAERLVQTNTVSLCILLLKIISKIIPLLATQKSKFLPIGSNLWEIIVSILTGTSDLRIIGLCINNLQELIRYGQTFFTVRFIDLFKVMQSNNIIGSLIEKQLKKLKVKVSINSQNKKLINQTSTSINWDTGTFNKICDFLIFALFKLGRFIPNDIAMCVINITIYHNKNFDDYGYFDDMANFVWDYKMIDDSNKFPK